MSVRATPPCLDLITFMEIQEYEHSKQRRDALMRVPQQ
jgi:hypothetical protein